MQVHIVLPVLSRLKSLGMAVNTEMEGKSINMGSEREEGEREGGERNLNSQMAN